VIINPKNLNSIEFDALTGICKAGSGCKISDINNYLKNYGYAINLQNGIFVILTYLVNPDTRLFTLLNENEVLVKSHNFVTIG
jgi:FAD/FMN-containing dehydrogenase